VNRTNRRRYALFRVGPSSAKRSDGRLQRMVLWRQCMKPGPQVKPRHGGAARGRPDFD